MSNRYTYSFRKRKTSGGFRHGAGSRGRWCVLTAWVSRAVREPMENRLRELGMEELFRTVEMPLIFTLHDMETAGISVKGEALAEYGNKLQEGIRALETKIYEQAEKPSI